MSAVLAWARGGDATVLALTDDTISVRSSVASPPGSRIEGALAGGGTVKMKVHEARRQEDGSFLLSGRPLDMTRETRERVQALL